MKAIKRELSEYLCRKDLLNAALLPAKIENTGFDGEPYTEKILSICKTVWDASEDNLEDPLHIVEQINEAIFKKYGLVGKGTRSKNVIDNPDQFYLHRVMEKKKGSPVAFAVLYKIICDQVGLNTTVLAFPSNYFIRVQELAGQFYVDPFDGGKVLTEREFQRKLKTSMQRNRLLSTSLYEEVDLDELVAKLIKQLKHVFVLKNSCISALRAVELLTVIHPECLELTRDRGILYCEMEYFSKAIDDLRKYIKSCPEAEDIKEIRKLATMLKGNRETMN